MSKRAEEAASIASYGWQSDKEGNLTLEMFPEPFRRGFVKGYEQAEKDTIERAVMWLEEHADEYNSSESAFDHMEEEMIIDFRKAMEEEQWIKQ